MAVKVGSFAKSTNTSVPVDQAVTGVGFKPRALILWTAGNTSADAVQDGYLWSVGFAARDAAEAITEGAIGTASEDNADTTNVSSRTAAKCITITSWGETLLAEADTKSFDTDGFTITWTTNDANAYIINYMAIGGANIAAAKVLSWQVASSTGDQAVTGAGFTPHAVLHAMTGATSLNTGTQSAYSCFGVMCADGTQWYHATAERDAQASSTVANANRDDDACLYKYTSSGTTDIEAAYVSMDADGFTVNLAAAGNSEYVYSLCIDGGSHTASKWQRGTTASTPQAQSVTGVGFQPEGLLFSTIAANTDFSGSSTTNLTIFLSASDGTNERAAGAWSDQGVATTDTKSYSDDDKAAVSFQNDMSALQWAAEVTTMDADGFSLSWTTTNGTDAHYVGHYALSGGAATTAKNWLHYAAQMGRVM